VHAHRESTAQQAASQARSQLAVAEAQLQAALAQENQARSNTKQSQAQLAQSIQDVTTMQPLIAQRAGREAAVLKAQYDLQRCQVYAPFDAWVTNMNISEGAYAHVGEAVFTLIDARKWYVVGNFRESQLNAIRAGMNVDVYVMSRPNRRFAGVVESASHGVTPQEVSMAAGLPSVQRSLNWVHLATRIPVRVRVKDPPQELFRIGESAVVIVRGDPEAR
jgi:membrane fusion protein, multidrug efflux system